MVEELANPNTKSVADAARKAGYAPSTVRSTVYSAVSDPYISEAIQNRRQRAIAHCEVSPEEVLGSAAFQMRSSVNDMLNKRGSFSIEKARETGAVDLIKKHKETIKTFTDNKGNTETTRTVEVEIQPNSDGRKEVANYIGLGFNNSNKQQAEWTDLDFARELFKRLTQLRGWEVEMAAERISKQYNVDPKLLTEGEK